MVYSSCGGNTYVVLDFYIRYDWVRVGWGATPEDADGVGPNQYSTLYPTGWRSIHTGLQKGSYWRVWQSPGDVLYWKKRCVNYV